MKVVFATHNQHKLEEVQAVFDDKLFSLCSLAEWSNIPPEETASTFVENALIKARYAAQLTGLPALADDSGILIDALGGAPGLYSSRVAGPDATAAENRQALLNILRQKGIHSSRAKFYCVMVMIQEPGDPQPIIGEGVWHGEVKADEKGQHGFGYDPMFFVPKYGCMAAELAPEVKLHESHRYLALQNLIQSFKESKK